VLKLTPDDICFPCRRFFSLPVSAIQHLYLVGRAATRCCRGSPTWRLFERSNASTQRLSEPKLYGADQGRCASAKDFHRCAWRSPREVQSAEVFKDGDADRDSKLSKGLLLQRKYCPSTSASPGRKKTRRAVSRARMKCGRDKEGRGRSPTMKKASCGYAAIQTRRGREPAGTNRPRTIREEGWITLASVSCDDSKVVISQRPRRRYDQDFRPVGLSARSRGFASPRILTSANARFRAEMPEGA